jgi:hypothetical protein
MNKRLQQFLYNPVGKDRLTLAIFFLILSFATLLCTILCISVHSYWAAAYNAIVMLFNLGITYVHYTEYKYWKMKGQI